MFEYAALVDAPVKRFTSIVTDPESEEAPVVAVVTTIPPVAVPVIEAPALIVAIEPEPVEHEAGAIVPAVLQATPTPISTPTPTPTSTPTPSPTPNLPPAPRPRTYAPPAPESKPSFIPALIGIAAAGVTAMWWLRRESHDR